MTPETPDAVEAHISTLRSMKEGVDCDCPECWAIDAALASLTPSALPAVDDTARLDYIERTFSGMTNRERYLPVQMIWGKGANGRTLREACDKYMKRDAAMSTPQESES